MSIFFAYVVRILHDNWSIKSGENGPDRVLKHLVAMFCTTNFILTGTYLHSVALFLLNCTNHWYVKRREGNIPP